MRALLVDAVGGRLRIGDAPDPVPGPGEVVVDVDVAPVNPLDVWVARGQVGDAAGHLPWIPGTEAAGRLAGAAVLVRGSGIGVNRLGTTAERVAVPASTVFTLPADVDHVHVAALGGVGVTAWNCIHEKAAVREDDRVLVLGATGGVGLVATQLARAAGAEVWGQTGSPAKVGAIVADHAVIAADGGELRQAMAAVRPTVVIDGLGGSFTSAAVDLLDTAGRLVLFGASAGDELATSVRTFYRKGLTLYGYANIIEPVERQHAVLVGLVELVRAGRLAVPYELVPLEEAASVHDRLLGREVTGKLVVDCRRSVRSG